MADLTYSANVVLPKAIKPTEEIANLYQNNLLRVFSWDSLSASIATDDTRGAGKEVHYVQLHGKLTTEYPDQTESWDKLIYMWLIALQRSLQLTHRLPENYEVEAYVCWEEAVEGQKDFTVIADPSYPADWDSDTYNKLVELGGVLLFSIN